jgi:hypothetical protein
LPIGLQNTVVHDGEPLAAAEHRGAEVIGEQHQVNPGPT